MPELFFDRLRTTAGLALALSALALGGCQSARTTDTGAVGVERQQTMLLSSEEVNRSAAQAYRQEMAAAQRAGRLNRNPQQVARVRAIAARLITASGAFRADARGWAWETNVLSAKAVNAWCMPGGKMAVYTGLIERLKPTDAELAAIMGHEIAHALREHGRERASQAMAASIGLSILGAATGMSSGAMDLSAIVVDVTIMKPNSRAFETEADRVGVELAARAGYDPRAAITLWQKMGALGEGQPPQFLSTHPSYESRIADLRLYADRVMPLYERARRGG
ncbi:MAG TPA: M48 family metallopeptidase [Burkholderiales bacterium]|nr:M48 family metallopeptidase [Burkholderiales bacterium]